MRTFLVCAVLSVLCFQFAAAQIPQTISYQGVLGDQNGAAVPDGSYNITFALYTEGTGGSALWSETRAITVTRGVFSVTLGEITPISISFHRPYWMGITVGTGTELSPRTALTSSPYSLKASSVVDSVITSLKLAPNTVVRSLNGLTDHVKIKAGSNVAVATAGDSVVISSSGTGGANTLDQAYDQGGAGSGRIITADAGALEVGGVDGVVFKGTYNNGTIPATGLGDRMMWYPKKGAFRAGGVDHSEWDDANIGYYSIAMGANPTASGTYSSALGVFTTASNYAATAMGNGATASGHSSTSMGYFAHAGGAYSTAIGYLTKAKSYASVVIGRYNDSTGTSDSWIATDPLFVIGNGSSSSSLSNAMTVLKNGTVGIGTTTPSAALDVGGAFKISATASLPAQTNYGVYLSGWDGATTDIGRLYVGDNTGWKFHFSRRIDSVTTDLMTIRDNGLVGIGTVNPSERLQVSGIVHSTTGGFKFPDGTIQLSASIGGGSGNTLDQAYDQGGAGAGRVITADAGALEVGGVDGVVLKGTFGSGTIPATGAGARMMWYPRLAAMRAGYISGGGWDHDSVGTYSFAAGRNAAAKGNYSFAAGDGTTARGLYSTALGRYTSADGDFSMATGRSTIASGYASTAMGNTTTASGNSSTAMGYNTVASNSYSTAIGHSTTAIGLYSTAIGRGITTQGNYSIGVALSDQAGVHVYDSNTMAIVGGKVGIGTTSPTTVLHVEGDFKIQKNNVTISANGSNITLQTTPGTTITIDTSGNITIGSVLGNVNVGTTWGDLNLTGRNVYVTAKDTLKANADLILLNATVSSPGAARKGDGVVTPLPSPAGIITGASNTVRVGD